MDKKLDKKTQSRISRLLQQYKKEKTLITNGTIKSRVVQGSHLPFSLYPAGAYSYPGPDITYTPAYSTASAVCLGCLDNNPRLSTSTNIPPINIVQPFSQIPSNFSTGAAGPLYSNIETGDSYRTFPRWSITPHGFVEDVPAKVGISTYIRSTNDTVGGGQPTSQRNGISTPFNSNYYLSNGPYWYNKWYNSGWEEIRLSQEGLLWTLWPLAKPNKKPKNEPMFKDLYFDSFNFGTSKYSNYKIGQLGFFYGNTNQGCIPFGSDESQSSRISPFVDVNIGQFGAPPLPGGMGSGLQGFNKSLLISTIQNLTILVVKVTEEIARIPNPISGIANNERFIYVGYDGWAIIRTSMNPVNPLAAQTYISPQTVTGNITENNYHVIFPPNFISSMLYKSGSRSVPIETINGLFQGQYFKPSDSRVDNNPVDNNII